MVGSRPAPGAVGPEEARAAAAAPTPEGLFRANLHVVEAAVRYVCSHYRLSGDESDEFAGEVRLRLIENDYEVLRRFQHRSSLKTYLAAVIQRQFLDFRNKIWGKWRPSAEARRLGAVAMRLERLISRDGLTFDEAVGVLQTNEQVPQSRDELYALFDRLPPRTTRRPVGDQALEQLIAQAETTEAVLVAREQADATDRAFHALEQALLTLDSQDQLIIRLHYVDCMTIADIARLMNLEPKPLYRRVARVRQELRSTLEAQGITADAALGTDTAGEAAEDEKAAR